MSNCLTLKRRGDFYEATGGDATIVGLALGLVVTRAPGPEPAPMIGVPAGRIAEYVVMLLALGHVVTLDPGVAPLPVHEPAQASLFGEVAA
jgi:DNA mismatch repair ATPase MutS